MAFLDVGFVELGWNLFKTIKPYTVYVVPTLPINVSNFYPLPSSETIFLNYYILLKTSSATNPVESLKSGVIILPRVASLSLYV